VLAAACSMHPFDLSRYSKTYKNLKIPVGSLKQQVEIQCCGFMLQRWMPFNSSGGSRRDKTEEI